MNKLLEEAIVSVERLSERDQELAAKFLLGFANPDAHHYQLSDQQLSEVELAKREVRQGKIASDAEMEEVWRRFDR
jgi:hypothetical protein